MVVDVDVFKHNIHTNVEYVYVMRCRVLLCTSYVCSRRRFTIHAQELTIFDVKKKKEKRKVKKKKQRRARLRVLGCPNMTQFIYGIHHQTHGTHELRNEFLSI